MVGKIRARGLSVLFVSIVNVMACEAAFADRDIVYAARYYLKPGSKGTSHYHIYRINPDGSGRKQLTFGAADDYTPTWSSAGKHIYFCRQGPIGTEVKTCQVAADGGKVEVLKGSRDDEEVYSPDRKYSVLLTWGDFASKYDLSLKTSRKTPTHIGRGQEVYWSPGSQYIAVDGGVTKKSYLYNVKTGEKAFLPAEFRPSDWMDAKALLAYSWGDNDGKHQCLALFDTTGSVVSKTPVHTVQGLEPNWANAIYLIPGRRDAVIYSRHKGRSGSEFYEASLVTGKMRQIALGNNLVWLPDGIHFVTDNPRGLAPYNGKRQVWVSPLSVVNYKTGKKRNIVDGLVEVMNFDVRSARN